MTSIQTRAGTVAVLAAIGAVIVASAANTQIFPSGPIRIVVPTAPSTPPDIISRVIATELSSSEGWKVIVENRPGGVMTIAGSDVLKQPADGTTLYAMAVPVTAAPAFLTNMPFQLDKDFAPVIKIATSYNVLVVNPSVPAESVSELVELIRSQPDKLTFSSVRNTIEQANSHYLKLPIIPIREVRAKQSKVTRAEPVSALYQQGRVHHLGTFGKLEDQMCEWSVDT